MSTPGRWELTLYVSGAGPRSAAAVEAVRRMCDEDLRGRCELAVVDVVEQPARAAADQILVVPTLLRRRPGPPRRLVGDLGDVDRLRADLGLAPPEVPRPRGRSS